MLWCSTPSNIGNASLDVEAMRDDAGVVMALQGGAPHLWPGPSAHWGKCRARDRTY